MTNTQIINPKENQEQKYQRQKFDESHSYTLIEQDSDLKYFDDKAPHRISKRISLSYNESLQDGLIVSRTRLEFPHEHLVYADSDYLKSLGNEDNIYIKFLNSQKEKEN
jgi:hypothetical protein